jgi:elongation factor Ts
MADFTAKDVQRLRQATGAGMMDAKRALTENDGDHDAAAKWLQEKGLASSAKRSDRENTEGAVALGVTAGAAALVELKSETDFVAKSADFVNLAEELAHLVAEKGADAVAERSADLDNMRITLKENIELGRVVRFEAAPGNVLDAYLHVQNDRGKNGVLVEVAGGTEELAHDIAVHIAFARPTCLSRDDFPPEVVAEQRQLLENQTRNEGKPEQALPKIVEGKLTGFFKQTPGGALLEQAFVKDEKKSIQQALGDATIVRFAQVEIGG